MAILNFTQYDTTPIQAESGVFDPIEKEEIKKIMNELTPTPKSIKYSVDKLVGIAEKYESIDVVVDGPAYLIAELLPELAWTGKLARYAEYPGGPLTPA